MNFYANNDNGYSITISAELKIVIFILLALHIMSECCIYYYGIIRLLKLEREFKTIVKYVNAHKMRTTTHIEEIEMRLDNIVDDVNIYIANKNKKNH